MLYEYLKKEYPKARNVYIGLVHRLDRSVGGVMVFAKTKPAAADLSKQIVENKFEKKYLTVVCGTPDKEGATLTDYLVKNEKLNYSKIANANHPKAKLAVLSYELKEQLNAHSSDVLHENDESFYDNELQAQVHARCNDVIRENDSDNKDNIALLIVTLKTGRHHQIRVQLSNCGLPVYGDGKYNIKFKNKKENIALWAYSLSFLHPKLKMQICVESKPEGYPFNIFGDYSK